MTGDPWRLLRHGRGWLRVRRQRRRAAAVAPLIAEVDRLRVRTRTLEAARAGGAAGEAVAGPVFVGGTGRSGTWALGRLLGAHPDIATIGTEVRFHAARGGFAGVLAGRESAGEYADRVARTMFRMAGPNGRVRGVTLVAPRERLADATAALDALADHDPTAALRAYTHTLLDPVAVAEGARTWVETTPANATAAAALHAVFPQATVVHSVRDGRDVAASVVTMPWGPDSFDAALAWWARRLRSAQRGARDADPARLHVVRLEELVHVARERELQRLLAAVGIADRARVVRWFDAHMVPERAHVGRWRREVDATRAAGIDRAYRRLYDELVSEGLACLPLHPDAVDALAAAVA